MPLRKYCKIWTTFWTGRTARRITALPNRDSVRVIATYLFSSPEANAFGLYQLPMEIITCHTGKSIAEITEAFNILQELEFAAYDEETQFVWVYQMAEQQLFLPLKRNDWQSIWSMNWWLHLEENPFLVPFYDRYKESLLLPEREAPSKGPGRGIRGLEGASKGQSQDHDQDHVHDLDHVRDRDQSQVHVLLGGRGGRNSPEVLTANLDAIVAAVRKWMGDLATTYIEGCKLVRIDTRKKLFVIWCPNNIVKRFLHEHAAELRKHARNNGVKVNRFVFQEAANRNEKVLELKGARK